MGVNGCGISKRMGWHIESGPKIGYWVANELDRGYFAERSNAIGLIRDNEIVAGVIYENWNGRSIMCHIVIKKRMTPEFVAAIFHYPFIVCGVEKIIVTIEDTNEKSVRVVKNMGFVEEGKVKDAHQFGDMLILTLSKSECRFLRDRYVKKISSPARDA